MQHPRVQDLAVQIRRKPVRTLLVVLAVVIAGRVLGEFAAGLIDGLFVGFTDAV